MRGLPFEEDERFRTCYKEMYIAFAFQLAYVAIMFFIAYGWGGKSLSEYTFILGMPSWFFACLATVVGFLVLLAFLCFRYFKDISIEAYVDRDGGGK